MKTSKTKIKAVLDIESTQMKLDAHINAICKLLPELEKAAKDTGRGSQGDAHDKAALKYYAKLKDAIKFANDTWDANFKI